MVPAPVALAGASSGGSAAASPFALMALSARADAANERPRMSIAMDARGDFNGSCTASQASTISPETPMGSCASYFADVTDYCCAAVGGIYDASFSVPNASAEMAAALDHPICRTSNYADMFSCYQFVTEAHCSGTTPVPYGVCSRNGKDTSNAARATSSASRIGTGGPARWASFALVVLLTAPLSLLV
ncbi:uncharacterized protein PFL1_04979 [Pseudozyma flocculosa PF-1]|nr:uncharacterized protein PFL1_04979 [Pseudozyma flocculosa PF-1]EPQ27441.1 hypothetical protein PFL1_04979 [Pseudozyma flocculosa PF-1]